MEWASLKWVLAPFLNNLIIIPAPFLVSILLPSKPWNLSFIAHWLHYLGRQQCRAKPSFVMTKRTCFFLFFSSCFCIIWCTCALVRVNHLRRINIDPCFSLVDSILNLYLDMTRYMTFEIIRNRTMTYISNGCSILKNIVMIQQLYSLRQFQVHNLWLIVWTKGDMFLHSKKSITNHVHLLI